MSAIRLLFVATSPVRGGVEEVVLSLLTRLDRQGFALGLAAPTALLEAMAPEIRQLDVETHAVSAESWARPREVGALAACIRHFHPDIVNAHLFRSTLVAAPLAKWLGVQRVVETYHGREAWRRGFIKGSFAVDRAVTRCVDRVIAVSRAAADFLVRVKRIPETKVIVIPNGRDLSVFKPGVGREAVRKEWGLGPEVPVLGVVGRLESQKGHAFLLHALPAVLAEFPDTRLVVVGDGSLRAPLAQLARELGILPHVLFTGARPDVPQLLDGMDIVVLPSLYEGMPLTAIEAAAMAKPIVATAVDGTPEVVQDGVTGRLVPLEDPAALAAGILDLLRDPAHAGQMAQAGRRRAFVEFDLGKQVARTASAYRAVLGRE